MRDLVFRGCTVAGGFLGLSLALKDYRTNSQRPRSTCHPHVITHAFIHSATQCIGTDLQADILSLVLPVGLGLLIGAVVGCLLALMIPIGRRPRISPRPRSSSSSNGRWIRARYWGKCRSCGCSVMPGDRIRHRPGHVLCTSCGER
jgi:hypothetical protein